MDMTDQEKFDPEGDIGSPSASNNASNQNLPDAPREMDLCRKDAVQCLLKGDKVFSLSSTDYGIWSALIGGQSNRKNCKFLTGEIVLNKDWYESKLSLQARWDNGNIEKLKQRSSDIAYGDRIFVLDRQCVSVGSRVCLASNPDLEGTVLAKRYLATGIPTCSPDLVYEDIDTNSLRRETHGSGYKDIKILYRGWLGITSGYRTRVYLQSQSEPQDDSFFSIVVDGSASQHLNIGEELNLGFNILRKAEFLGGETGNSNWLVNFFKYYNTTASVVDFEIDQLFVCWIGKASAPNAPPNQFELANAPEDLIPYDELCHVHYFLGDSHNHITPKSLWIYERSEQDCPVSKDNWTGKWLKIMDWDRWEYPTTDDVCHQLDLLRSKYITLEMLFTRSVVDVCWSNGNVTTLNSGEILPVHVGSVWFEMMKYQIGSIVRDRLDSERKEKYGIIVDSVDKECVSIKWITPNNCKGGKSRVTVSTASTYNLTEDTEYDFISKTNQFPIVCCGDDRKLGVVLGIDMESHKTRVKIVGDTVESYWPHEITHYKCDILLCPIDSRWTPWYAHLSPPSGIVQVEPDPSFSTESLTSSVAFDLPSSSPKPKVELLEKVPSDNIFISEEIILPTRETSFYKAIEQEIIEMERGLPDGMWVERYIERGDIFSAVITGPSDSMFEDFIFVFDIFLIEDFPKSEPHVNFRSMGVTLMPDHFCKSGAVFLPEETRLTDEDFSFSYILNILLEIKDFMGIPLDLIHKRGGTDALGMKPEEPEELSKFVALAVLDYALALLRNPPKNWRSVVINHFVEALPRIIERFKKGGIEIKHPIATVNNEKGDSPKTEEYKVETIPWTGTFLKGVNCRIMELEKIHASMRV